MAKILDNKTVLVSGAGSGIGRALALEFARHGGKVACFGRRKDRLDETVALIEAQGGSGLAVAADITVQSEVKAGVDQVRQAFGEVDFLFNNAGSFNSIAGVWEADPDIWWRDVEINLRGTFLLIHEVLPAMIKRDSGIIVSMNGGRPVGGSGYACGKAGLMELTRVLNEELRHENSNVLVYAAGPGLVKTEMTALQANSEAGKKWIPSTHESFESGRLRAPEDIAQATIKLLEIAKLENSGKYYTSAADFSDF